MTRWECRKGFGGIAQLAEHELCKLGVTGSNPVASTIALRAVVPAEALAKAGRIRGRP